MSKTTNRIPTYKEHIILKLGVACRNCVHDRALDFDSFKGYPHLTSPHHNWTPPSRANIMYVWTCTNACGSHHTPASPRRDSIPHLTPILNLTSPHFHPSHLLPKYHVRVNMNQCMLAPITPPPPTGPRRDSIPHLPTLQPFTSPSQYRVRIDMNQCMPLPSHPHRPYTRVHPHVTTLQYFTSSPITMYAWACTTTCGSHCKQPPTPTPNPLQEVVGVSTSRYRTYRPRKK